MRALLLMLTTVAVSAQTPLSYDGSWTDSASGQAAVVLPEGYGDLDRQWPLLIFLHGAGERGSDLDLAVTHGPIKERRQGRDLPFVIVAPQVPEGGRWTVGRVAAALDAAMETYRIDESRVYITGLSMGGFGTWEAIERMPERFAAAVAICGGGNPIGLAAARDVPVWAFHGDADTVVPLAASAWMVRTLEAAGGDVRFTVYPGVGHDSWSETYANPEVYEWLLSHALEDE
ncbi:prolyl oligopeptidase family serine peptidase [Rubrivirga sp.]|uniref:carboxylesterase family protein n=1 Tax=Rubrivirga sp. TaxID=1885344 RepID=UPI003C7068D0